MASPVVKEFCAQCLSEEGPFERRPYGKDGADVNVCNACETEHPRLGRYNFSEAARLISHNGHRTKTRR